MSLFGICALTVAAAFLALLLRAKQPEQALSVELLAGVLVTGLLLIRFREVFTAAESWLAAAGLPAEYLRVIFRAVGICLLTQLAADTCRDAGEQSLAAKAELAGKCFMLLLALPLFERLLSLVTGLIRGEGMT